MSYNVYFGVILGILGLYITKTFLSRKGLHSPLPPGPRPKPIIGNISEAHTRDPLVHISKLALDHFSTAGTPGAWLVDMIPACTSLFKTAGYPIPGSENELIAKWTAASLYTGGADTNVCAVECFFLAMTLFPDIQRKAQEEIDQLLGSDQLPKHPVASMGIPHASSEDDTWEGYSIPKGSLLMPNIWAMTHDPAIYHDPMTFKPERFLGIDGRGPEMDPHDLVFGFGCHICPARFLADTTVYLSAAQSLAVFNIRPIDGQKGKNVRPEFKPGVVSHPTPWKFQIEPRSASHEALIEQVNPWEQSHAPELERLSK
ncbi:hypothetical protein N7508_005519 [Penicillium antarcticum]|uniref:uncharacterized protein n=1 Tax=Penicillium antarcticum TaxID=416450 RepID=UPI002382D897|nr:uncharacterized protein N7508_005519 [Penicillium antarcticum]KAJ5306504.1 hypothetical protein N7508_005519 [Penicillium antarcticum]